LLTSKSIWLEALVEMGWWGIAGP